MPPTLTPPGNSSTATGPWIAGAEQVRPAHVERFAPRIAALGDAARRGFDGPGAGLGPLGVGRQSLADPTRVGPRFEPADADHRQPLLAACKLAVGPVSRARGAGLIDEVQQRRQRFFVPEFKLLVAAGVDELLVLLVRDAKPIEICRLDVHQVSRRQPRIGVARRRTPNATARQAGPSSTRPAGTSAIASSSCRIARITCDCVRCCLVSGRSSSA